MTIFQGAILSAAAAVVSVLSTALFVVRHHREERLDEWTLLLLQMK